MVRDINGLGGYTSPKSVTEQSGNKAFAVPVKTNNATSSPSESGDEVQLSTEAKTLQSLADQVNQLPDVNLARAEQIKAALENGDYKINDLVVAEKILNSEVLLGS